MSTKNLARTVIEGGRTDWSRWYRRRTLREHRGAERALLHRIRTGGDAEAVAFIPRQSASTGFADKLGPARRWLGQQVGRPWDLVRSELVQRFDTRTTPGRHIVFCHVLPWVEDGWHGRREFEVDVDGLLRRLPPRRYQFAHPQPLPRSEHELERWLAGRRVGERGNVLFWFTLTPAGAFRQHHRLDDEDAELWRSLPPCFRKKHYPVAPVWVPAR